MTQTHTVPPSGVTEPTSTSAQPCSQRRDGATVRDAAGRTARIQWRRLLQRKLLIRMTVPTLIGLVQLAIAIVAIVTGEAPVRVLLWALPALLVGYLFGRSTKIAWDDEKAQVSLIRAQLLLTVAYIVVRVGAHIALERTLDGRMWLVDVVLLVSFGLFVGRTVGLARQIRQALSSRSGLSPANVTPR